jgi:hypothetical protein
VIGRGAVSGTYAARDAMNATDRQGGGQSRENGRDADDRERMKRTNARLAAYVSQKKRIAGFIAESIGQSDNHHDASLGRGSQPDGRNSEPLAKYADLVRMRPAQKHAHERAGREANLKPKHAEPGSSRTCRAAARTTLIERSARESPRRRARIQDRRRSESATPSRRGLRAHSRSLRM